MGRSVRVLLIPVPDEKQKSPYIRILHETMKSYCKNYVTVVVPKRKIYNMTRLMNVLYIGFTWITSSDILHINWPEIFLGFTRSKARVVKVLLFTIFIIVISIAKLLGKKLIITHHNITPHNGYYNHIEYSILRKFFQKSHKIILLNRTSYKYFLKIFGNTFNDKCNVIPHPHFDELLGTRIEKGLAREKLSLDKNKFIVIHVGTVKRYKDPETLINIISYTCTGSQKVLFIIIGKQEFNFIQKIRQATTIYSDECVSIINKYVNDSELVKYLSASDIALLNYRIIWSSAPLHLYLSYKVPVLARFIPTIVEEYNLKDLQYYFKDYKEASQKIIKLSSSPHFYKMFVDRYNTHLCRWFVVKDPRIVCLRHILLYYSLYLRRSV